MLEAARSIGHGLDALPKGRSVSLFSFYYKTYVHTALVWEVVPTALMDLLESS